MEDKRECQGSLAPSVYFELHILFNEEYFCVYETKFFTVCCIDNTVIIISK